MVFYYSWKHLLAITLAIFLAGTSPRRVSGQNCGCQDYYCCSKDGYCGIGLAYCGDGCQSGNCYPLPPSNNVSVSDIVTDAFFNGIADQASANCSGKGFYTRAAFLEAASFYPRFGTVGFEEDSKREIAAFFAHVTHETGHLCYIDEIDGQSKDYCDRTSTRYPCAAGKSYYGRGPLQLTWNYNYGAAGENISFDGLNNPDIVAQNPVVSFRTALWFWMNNCHYSINAHRGFGVTIRAINSNECSNNPTAVEARIRYYKAYCNEFQVDPGTYLTCINDAFEAKSSIAIK